MIGIRKAMLAGVACVGLALAGAGTAAAAPVSVGHSGWTWGSPTPQGKDLTAVTFVGNTGYAVGTFGTALKSTDGGATWSGLATGTVDGLDVVQELDPNTVIVGGGCALDESTNGGASFVRVAINPSDSNCSDSVTGASFTSASTGFVEQSGGEILFTNDGGQTVQAKTAVPLPNGDQPLATGLQFTSPTTGFAVTGGDAAGTIQRTTDGANSWTEVGSSPNGLNALTFVNPTTAFAVGDRDTLLESTDGGATWAAKPLVLPAGSSTPDLEHIACSDALNCLISLNDSRSLIRTTDGGLTGSLVTPSGQTLADVAFATGSNVVGVGGNGATVISANGGAQFPTTVSGGSQLPVTDETNAPLVAGGAAGAAYLLGQTGQIEATTNGGTTWTVLRVPSSGDVTAAAFPNASTGYAITDDGVLRKTVDGGIAWSSLDAGVSQSTQLVAPTASDVLLVGPHGIRRSTDGGQTFTKVPGRVKPAGKGKGKGPAVSSLSLGSAVYEGHTVFVSSRTVLAESTNGGAAWRAVPLPPKTAITQVSFVSATTGYVLDRAGDVLFTRNRGTKWTKLLTTGTQAVGSISFSSASKGLLALYAGVNQVPIDLLATTNGGKTWQPEIVDGGLGGLVLATAGHDYYVDGSSEDEDGTSAVFATANGGASPLASHLSISIGPKTLTAAALKRKHHNRVTIKGKLNPVTAEGSQVLVQYRTPNRGWNDKLVNVASNGAFQVTIKGVRSTTDFVVYADGDGVHGGAGAYVQLTVK